MGAWGVKVYDNDSAADWFGDTLEPVADAVGKLLDLPVEEHRYDKYRAAAWLLTKIGRNYVYCISRREDHLTRLHDRLQTIRADKAWMDSWGDEEEIIKEIDEQIAQIQRVCKWNNVTVTI